MCGLVRWGTWLVGKEKEASFETAFKRTKLRVKEPRHGYRRNAHAVLLNDLL